MEETVLSVSSDDTQHLNLHRMVVLQPDEKVICIINRHPFGIIQQYITGTLTILAMSIVILLTIPGKTSSDIAALFYIALAAVIFVLVGVLGVATHVYWENKWVITSDSLTQVTQGSLFGIRSSSLSLEHLEDITVDQHGFLQRTLNFGTLKVETGNDSSKFHFAYCPEPLEYARKIIDAKEKYLLAKK